MMKCNLCGSEKQSVFDFVESFGFALIYYQCERCGLVFQSAEQSQAGDPAFYAETYRKIYQNSEMPTPKDLWVQEKRAAHLVMLVRKVLPESPKRLLDIGASTGTLLAAFQKAFGSQAVGVEPGDAYRAHAEGRGLAMVGSLEQLFEQKPERFDLVSLIHVMEHLPEPVETLRRIRKELLSPDGLLLVEVPNFYAHDSYELAHLSCFTPHTLKTVLSQAGFDVKGVLRHGKPRSALLNLYITAFARPLPEGSLPPALTPERHVQRKRKMGLFYRRVVQKVLPHRAWLPLPEETGVRD